jgi:hypothetical protein
MATPHSEPTASVTVAHPASDSIHDSAAMPEPDEDQPLLRSSSPVATWKPPTGFLWIQLGL